MGSWLEGSQGDPMDEYMLDEFLKDLCRESTSIHWRPHGTAKKSAMQLLRALLLCACSGRPLAVGVLSTKVITPKEEFF